MPRLTYIAAIAFLPAIVGCGQSRSELIAIYNAERDELVRIEAEFTEKSAQADHDQSIWRNQVAMYEESIDDPLRTLNRVQDKAGKPYEYDEQDVKEAKVSWEEERRNAEKEENAAIKRHDDLTAEYEPLIAAQHAKVDAAKKAAGIGVLRK
jgi:hypothetical protein